MWLIEYRFVPVDASVGPAYLTAKAKKESEALFEPDGLCSSEHGFWGIGVSWCPIGGANMQVLWAAPKVQSDFLLYSNRPINWSAGHMILTKNLIAVSKTLKIWVKKRAVNKLNVLHRTNIPIIHISCWVGAHLSQCKSKAYNSTNALFSTCRLCVCASDWIMLSSQHLSWELPPRSSVVSPSTPANNAAGCGEPPGLWNIAACLWLCSTTKSHCTEEPIVLLGVQICKREVQKHDCIYHSDPTESVSS